MSHQTRILALIVLGAYAGMATCQDLFFVRDNNEIWRADLDGGNQQMLFSYPNDPSIDEIAYDGENGKLYLATNQQGPGFNIQAIDSINVDGTGFTQLVNAGSQFTVSLAYNPVDNKIYWLDQGATRNIRRANAADGSNSEVVLTDPDATFRSIRIHIADQQVFWTDGSAASTGPGSLRSAPATTGASETTVWNNLGNNTLQGFDFDFAAGEVYWIFNTGTIERGDIDGTGTITPVTMTGGANARNLVVDRTNNALFWVDQASDEIRTANLDGSGQTTVIATNVTRGLAIANPDLPVSLERFDIE